MNLNRLSFALVAASLVGGATALRATDWTTTDGKTYTDVKLIKRDADTVTILDEDGGARISLDRLPADLQKRFGYDPVAAKAAAEARAKEEAANAKALQAEMDEASVLHQAGREPVRGRWTGPSPAPDPSLTPSSTTAGPTTAPAAVFNTNSHHVIDAVAASASSLAADPNDANHHTIDEASQAAAQMRPNLSDPNYHTMAHMFYTVKSLGPDPNDAKHHTMDDVVNSSQGQ